MTRSARASAPNGSGPVVVLFLAMGLLAVVAVVAITGFAWGVFPDEQAHLGLVADVVRRGFPDYEDGLLYESGKLNYLPHPALYYLLAGSLAKGLPESAGSLILAGRGLNLLFSLLTLLTLWSVMRAVGMRAGAMAMALFTLLSIPMFVFLTAAVNNDPLTVFGATLFSAGLLLVLARSDPDLVPSDASFRWSPMVITLLLSAGFVIAGMTKLTGAFAVVCLSLGVALVGVPRPWARIADLRGVRGLGVPALVLLAGLSIVAVFYGAMFVRFGEFFPSAQGDPSTWYQVLEPMAPRYSIGEHLAHFHSSNVNTLTRVYGHVEFADLTWREPIGVAVLASMPLAAILVLSKRSGVPRWQKRLVGVTLLATIVFLAVYFIQIRTMHLRTGYPGAMQGRYLFGLLPLWAVITGLGWQALPGRFLRAAAIALPVVASSTLLYPAARPHFERPAEIAQLAAGTNFGELVAGRSFEQTFDGKGGSLHRIELFVATFARTNDADLILTIMDQRGVPMGRSGLPAEAISDNTWVSFPFENVVLEQGQKYSLRLTSSTGSPGNAHTWWAVERIVAYTAYNGTRLGPSDFNRAYDPGSARVDGQPVRADFAYRVYLH